MIYTIIPARHGSKGVPGKNWSKLNGIPLICYSIELALQSKELDQIMITTDSPEVANIVHSKYDIPKIVLHDRPAHLATDEIGMTDVILDVIDTFTLSNSDEILLLQPTSPMRLKRQLENILRLDIDQEELIISYSQVGHGISWLFTQTSNGMQPLTSEMSDRRQDDTKLYTPNGAFYRFKVNQFVKQHSIYYTQPYGYIMDELTSIDIDTPLDWEFAEFLLSSGKASFDFNFQYC